MLQFVGDCSIWYYSECKKIVSKHELEINSTLDTACFFLEALFRQIFKSTIGNSFAEQSQDSAMTRKTNK